MAGLVLSALPPLGSPTILAYYSWEGCEDISYCTIVTQTDVKLSETLTDPNVQNLAYAVRAYVNPGKLGFYMDVLERYETKYAK